MNQVQQFFEYILNAIKIWIIVQPWETGLRVRCGKRIKLLKKGIYFRIPYFDSVYIQQAKLRVVSLAMQTVTTKDLKTLTINGSLGYTISNVEKLYQTLYHPETTVANLATSIVSEFVFDRNLDSITPESIEKKVVAELNKQDYGLTFSYFKVNNFAVVRAFRIIKDEAWIDETMRMDRKT